MRLYDCRTPDTHTSWKVSGEVERLVRDLLFLLFPLFLLFLLNFPTRVLWDHFTPYHCLASTESGTVHYIDIRKVRRQIQSSIKPCYLTPDPQPTPLWTLSAHTEGVTGLALSPHCPGTLTTVSQDKGMKVERLLICIFLHPLMDVWVVRDAD